MEFSMKKYRVPRNSFAHQLIRLNGWSLDAAINEIAGMNQVKENEAERRFDAARQQQINREVGQSRGQSKIKMAPKTLVCLHLNLRITTERSFLPGIFRAFRIRQAGDIPSDLIAQGEPCGRSLIHWKKRACFPNRATKTISLLDMR